MGKSKEWVEGLQTSDGSTRDSLQTLNIETADDGGPTRRKHGERLGPRKFSHY